MRCVRSRPTTAALVSAPHARPAVGTQGEATLTRPNVPQEPGFEQAPESLGFIPESERFITDIASVEKVDRDAAISRQQQICYAKR